MEDCREYHDAVEKAVVPVLAKIHDRRKTQLGLNSLKPWDLDVDPQEKEPLKPFETVEQYAAKAKKVFDRIDSDLGAQFQEMIDLGLLDLASRKGKAPGGYQTNLWEAGKPFIFINAVGSNDDLRVIFHEAGHAFHSLACADHDLMDYRHAPIEFCEVASQAMELFADQHLEVFYNSTDAARAKRNHLEMIVFLLSWIATVDAFQHWIYENPGHNSDQRCRKWLEINNRLGAGLVDWSGLGFEQEYRWQQQLHLYEVPLYYIEYGISLLGALGIWVQSKQDNSKALANYRKALALGGSRPLPELFAAAGLDFDFSEKTIVPLMEKIEQELALPFL